MKQFLFLLLLFVCSGQLRAQPKQEIRAVWLTTNHALDWPEKPVRNSSDVARQQEELCNILDAFKKANFNVVLLQTRIRGNVIYPSLIEPRSSFIWSNTLSGSNYDPLDFAIKACHERGLECHAWFVTYPLGQIKVNGKPNSSPTISKNNALVKKNQGELYLDPGDPRTSQYLLSLVKEIVSRYDIDGFHLDYIRYPDKTDVSFDQSTYRLYGRGENLGNWRRGNINRFVYAVYDSIKALKPWVQVSSSVIGMYEKISGNTQAHWTAYSSVYQDPADWLKKGKHDFIVPMMYYSDNLFFPFINNWMEYRNDRLIVPGIGLYRMDKKEGDWAPQTVLDQIKYSRENHTQGNAYYRARFLLENKKGILDEISARFYSTPALLPPLTWLDSIPPSVPFKPDAIEVDSALVLSWETHPEANKEVIYYNLYCSENFPVDTNDPNNLIATHIPGNQITLSINKQIVSGYYFLITASDRFHNESPASSTVYFCTGPFEK